MTLDTSEQRRPISFIEALALLQGLLGSSVYVDLSSNRLFLSANWGARLESIETLHDHDQAVILHCSGGATIELEPSEMEAFVRLDDSAYASQLEFRFEHGLVLKLERVAAHALDG